MTPPKGFKSDARMLKAHEGETHLTLYVLEVRTQLLGRQNAQSHLVQLEFEIAKIVSEIIAETMLILGILQHSTISTF